MLTVKLYPAEFMTMLHYVGKVTAIQYYNPLKNQSVAVLVLMAYYKRWKSEQILRWKAKNPTKAHSLRMPLPVVKSLYDELRLVGFALTDQQVMLLGRLDQALVNYVDPDQQLTGYLIENSLKS